MKQPVSRNEFRKSQSNFHVTNNKCIFCNMPNHRIYKCFKFLNLTVPARKAFVHENSLCENCLRCHPNTSCTSSKCRKCNKDHHSLLHEEPEVQNATSAKGINQAEVTSHLSRNPPTRLITLMPTAVIQVLDGYGQRQPCRALLDSASQTSFVSERCVQRLGLHRKRVNIRIYGLTTSTVGTARGKDHSYFRPVSSNNSGSSLPAVSSDESLANAQLAYVNEDNRLNN
ncbi:hypothetical protein JTE90_023496 [Oedothorax gibbosus]|uniref:Peptidase aspartic putative domain-containing protein n=1 Tax=Oedothorax gibbosus TaxID=931172 RepID=A0AAV6VQE9_9ARAC|nr:hypothetical protein JTE90_009313 [Oedothorax gibbosus]KAG8198730.1 hypothetical protein JTE90_023496 [Oedothorax gibbosus]